MKKPKPELIMEKKVFGVRIALTKTLLFYDILALSDDRDKLEWVKNKYGTTSYIIEDSIYDTSLVVLDTFTELDDAVEVYNKIEDIIDINRRFGYEES